MTERFPHPSHVTASGPGHITGLDRTPADHGPRCSVCAPEPVAPDCPHGMYRGDWCDGCGTEVPYPSEVNGPDDDDLAAAGMIGEAGGASGWCLAAWRESDEAHR